jgi:hypothetical protein
MLADRERAEHGAVENRPHDRVEAVRGQVLGGDKKIAGRVVDETVDLSEPSRREGDERVDLSRFADVGGKEVDVAALARRRTDLPRRSLQALRDLPAIVTLARTGRMRPPWRGRDRSLRAGDDEDLSESVLNPTLEKKLRIENQELRI